MPIVQLLLGGGLEVEDRQRLVRRRDQLRRGGPPSRNGSWPSAWRIVGESATLGQGGAGGQHAQELAPVGPRGAQVELVTLLQTSNRLTYHGLTSYPPASTRRERPRVARELPRRQPPDDPGFRERRCRGEQSGEAPSVLG